MAERFGSTRITQHEAIVRKLTRMTAENERLRQALVDIEAMAKEPAFIYWPRVLRLVRHALAEGDANG